MPAHQQRPSTTNNKFLKNWESFKLGVHAYSWRVLNTGEFGVEWGKGWQSLAPVDWDLGQSVKSTVTFHRFQLAPSVPGGWVPQNSSSMSFRLIFTFKKELGVFTTDTLSSYCSWGSQGKNAEVVCHSLLQWTTFSQTSPPLSIHLGWPHTAWLSFTELDKAVVLWSDWLVFCDYGLVCLPSDAFSQHLLSYLGFSYLGRGASLHGCSSKAQPLLLWTRSPLLTLNME